MSAQTKNVVLRTKTYINKNKGLVDRIIKYWRVYTLLAPTLIFFLVFHYVPMFGNIIAFQRFSIARGILGSDFVGFENFVDFLINYKFWELLTNTFKISFYRLVFVFPAPVIFALLLNEIRAVKFKKSVQTITYLPHFISVVVVSGMILNFVSYNGIINSLRVTLNMDRINFMIFPEYFYTILISSDIWQHLGWESIIYIAALAAIDQELYEAATVDGAGRWDQMCHITLPSLLPTIMILLIMRIGRLLSVGHEKIILLYNPSIYETADVISTYVYRRGLLEGSYGYSAAVGIFNSLINFILLLTANYTSKKVTSSGLW